MGRKIPFENVVKNLKLHRYRGKILQSDYSNLGIQLFQERQFADNLGVNFLWLRKIGLVKITDQCGWNLPTEPSIEELIKFKDKIQKKVNS
ncbi:hypothetical protein LCGC14_2426110 [marine sediment metagenome]|uniref:Uncharacterized protein n=1 Tax=marine sediment metagenome TaxID=412755 RepID=A0A0F9BNA1_9ZZZZ